MSPLIYLITGLGGSGKTTLSQKLAEELNLEPVHMDNHKFGENWVRKSYEECRESLFSSLDLDKGRYVIEGICWSSGDKENQSWRLFQDLLPYAKQVRIIDPDDKVTHIASLIDRSIRRYTGEEEQGTCVESSTNRARLVIRCVENYPQNVAKLDDFECLLQTKNIDYEKVPSHLS